MHRWPERSCSLTQVSPRKTQFPHLQRGTVLIEGDAGEAAFTAPHKADVLPMQHRAEVLALKESGTNQFKPTNKTGVPFLLDTTRGPGSSQTSLEPGGAVRICLKALVPASAGFPESSERTENQASQK